MKAEIQGKINHEPRTFPWKMRKALETRLGKMKLKKMEISSNTSTVGRVSTSMWFVACTRAQECFSRHLDNECFFLSEFSFRVIPTLNEYPQIKRISQRFSLAFQMKADNEF